MVEMDEERAVDAPPPRPPANLTEIWESRGGGQAAWGALMMGAVFFRPWIERGAAWVMWVVGTHPGLLFLGLLVVAVATIGLGRRLDRR